MDKLLSGLKVAMDDGHGGVDPGAVDPIQPAQNDHIYTEEKDINTQLAQIMTSKLVANGAEVLDVRPGDATVSLDERVNRANSWGADLFFSWHSNSATNVSAGGAEAHVFSKTSKAYGLAQKVQERFLANGIKWRSIWVSNFKVLRETRAPAILMESGFITNPAEELLLNDCEYLEKLANAGFEAVCLWYAGKLPETKADSLVEAITVIKESGVQLDENCWAKAARPGGTVDGGYANVLLHRIANILRKEG